MTKITQKHQPHSTLSVAEDHTGMILDDTKIAWHTERVEAWEAGERIAPITVDMALTRACNYSCVFCLPPDEPISVTVIPGLNANKAIVGLASLPASSSSRSSVRLRPGSTLTSPRID